MRTLNIYRTYFPDPPGGLQEAIRQICLATNCHGISNRIFTLSPNPQPNVINMPEGQVIREKSWFSPASCDIGGISALKTYLELVDQSDVVHYFHPWPFADALNIFKNAQKPALLTYISDVVRQRFLGALYSPLMWKTLHSMDIIVANCPAYVESSPILSNPSIQKKVRVIPLGIDENSYIKTEDKSVFDRIAIKTDEPYFLFLGVLRYYKGIHTLISASKNLKAKVVIAGSGPELDNLKKQVKELEIKNIFFAGQVTNEEKVALIKNCLALILPSHLRSEAYGMVLVEASMMNKPMISCELGTGTSYVNLNDHTGIVVSPETPSEMNDAMRTLLNNQQLAQTYGDNARARYESLFSGKAMGKAYSDIYKELAS